MGHWETKSHFCSEKHSLGEFMLREGSGATRDQREDGVLAERECREVKEASPVTNSEGSSGSH